MLSDVQRDKIRAAFRAGTLRTKSVSPVGCVEWKRVLLVNRAEVPWETIYEGETPKGTFVLTAGHRVFVNPVDKLSAEEMANRGPGTLTLCVDDGPRRFGVWPFPDPSVGFFRVGGLSKTGFRQFMYDMTVDDWHNFVLVRSGIVVSNSPDKFYHFRPPEHEGEIGRYNRVFGQIWEDAELYEYLVSALDWFNMFPPFTGNSVTNIDSLVSSMPAWRTAIIWNAITQACFALFANWVADEFEYSIGGVSLSLEKSSKYQAMMDAASAQFDKATEAKARTVKFIRGLQQPRFGIGVRSSFGPYTARGVLSPRNFMVWAMCLLPLAHLAMNVPGLTT